MGSYHNFEVQLSVNWVERFIRLFPKLDLPDVKYEGGLYWLTQEDVEKWSRAVEAVLKGGYIDPHGVSTMDETTYTDDQPSRIPCQAMEFIIYVRLLELAKHRVWLDGIEKWEQTYGKDAQENWDACMEYANHRHIYFC